MRDLFDLKAKTAVVTGGAGLLGKAIARGLASYGATVYVADLDIRSARAVCAGLQPQRGRLVPVTLDITKLPSIRSCIRKILSETGKIDIWVNNAYPRTKDWGNVFEKIKPSSWRKMPICWSCVATSC